MARLEGTVAIVTGASAGIGAATAKLLSRAGAAVTVVARRGPRVDAVAREMVEAGNPRTLAYGDCDVADLEQMRRMAEATLETFGRIDVIVNNAGIMPLAPMVECRADEWSDMIDVNIKGVLHGIAVTLPHFVERGTGHVVNVSSTAGRRVVPLGTVYSATKFAVHALSEGLRHELALRDDGNRIRVSVIAPGIVETELISSIRSESLRKELEAQRRDFVDPLTGEDVAEAIVYAVGTPPHVNVNEILMRPTTQAP